MEDPLLALGLLIIVAKVAEGLASRLGQTSLIAYLLTGIMLGPVFGVIDTDAEFFRELHLFFSVGVIFLFFLIGVDEIDISGFMVTLRGRFLAAAAIGFLIPFAVSFPVVHYMIDVPEVIDVPVATSIAIAGLISLSSLGVVAKILSDKGHLRDQLGLQIFTTVTIVELIGLLVVGFAIQDLEDSSPFSPWTIPALLLQVGGFAVVAWIIASKILPPLVTRLRKMIGTAQFSFAVLTAILLLVVVAAENIGLHASLGALLFGAALSGLPSRLRSEVLPGLRSIGNGLFIPLFFTSAGLAMDSSFTSLSALTVTAVVLVAIFGKLAGAFAGVFIARLTTPLAIASGLMGKGVAEIALLGVMLESGFISQEVFSLLTLIMIGFIFVVPPVIISAINRAKIAENPTLPGAVPPSYARHALEDVTVKDVLIEGRELPGEDLSVEQFVEHWVVPGQADYVVIGSDDKLAGVLSMTKLRGIPRYQWARTPVSKLLRHNVPSAKTNDTLDNVLESMAEHLLSTMPIVDTETLELLGAVTSHDIMSAIVDPGGPGH